MNSVKYKQNLKKSLVGKIILGSIFLLVLILSWSLYYDLAGTTDILLLISMIVILVVVYQLSIYVLFTDEKVTIKFGPLNIKKITMYDVESIKIIKINPALNSRKHGIRSDKNSTAFVFEGASLLKIRSKNNKETIITYPENIDTKINIIYKKFL